MSNFPKFNDIKETFDEFWSKSKATGKTSMYGLADIWEGPPSVVTGSNTVLAIESYRDNVYVLYGGGIRSWLKVVTPDGPRIYDLGSSMILMTNSPHSKMFSMAVINENEVVAGYMYLNLEHQFYAPFGIDLSAIYKNPSFNISNIRVNASSWLTSIRDIGGWTHILFSKASAEDCLPCSEKKKVAKTKFSCMDIEYSRPPGSMPGYESSGLSYTTSGYGKKLSAPRPDIGKCIKAMDQYSAVFNHQNISPKNVGDVGYKISKYCPSILYKKMVEVSLYKAGAESLKKEYTKKLLKGINDIAMVIKKSKELTGQIGSFLYGISSSLGKNDFTLKLMRDTVWWGPIWFNANSNKLNSVSGKQSVYSLLNSVSLEEFISILQTSSSQPLPGGSNLSSQVGWVVVGKSGSSLSKYSANGMTYFRFPAAQCVSGRKIFSTQKPNEMDGVCGVETRANGAVIWGLKYGRSSVLKCWFISNSGAVKDAGSTVIPSNFVPTSNAPMAVTDLGGEWGIMDYYLADFGNIMHVDSKVTMGGEIQQLRSTQLVSSYANVNEVRGNIAEGHMYADGTLDSNYGRYDLDSGEVINERSWGNNGKQFSFIGGYSGYQIKTAGLL